MRLLIVLLGCLLLAGCDSSPLQSLPSSTSRPSTAPKTSQPATHPSTGTPASTRVPAATGTSSPPIRVTGATTGKLLGRVRIVAYYGAPGSDALGVLGAGSAEHAAQGILRRAAGFRGFGRPVQPAMELIATIAQGSPGPDGDYSAPVPQATIRQYLAVAHRHKMLLILDLQPGRASFLDQAKRLRPLLLDPSVHLALDPEWKVGPNGRPGNGFIGSSSARGVNDVGAWLSRLVRTEHLPDKLLVVHQFTFPMLPDRQHLSQHPGVEMALHADGFGRPSSKINIFHQLAFPHPPFGIGFKLFLRQDSRLMTPREVMALRPQPDIVTYQ